MTRTEKVEYINEHLTDLTAAQAQEVNTKVIWGSNEDFKEWVADAKIRYQKQATNEEINLVMSHMQGAGNNATKQLAADHALKKVKEDQLLKDAISQMRI